MKIPTPFLWSASALALATTLSLAACNKPPGTTGASPPPVSVGTEIDDSVLTTTIKAALLAQNDVKSFDLKVETRKGDVLLSGFVDNQSQVDHAVTTVRGVAGVKSVDNRLAMKGMPATLGETADDAIVTTKVKTALLEDVNVKSLDIAVVTLKGDVQLSGFVDNQGQIDQAVKVARGVEGVHSIHDELRIKK